MKLGYTVSKEKGGQWYCHQVGFPYVPVFGSFGDKKKSTACCSRNVWSSIQRIHAVKTERWM